MRRWIAGLMTTGNDILRRKAAAAREARETRVMTPRRAFRRALCRAAQLGLSLPLQAIGGAEALMDRDSVIEQIGADGLLVLLERDGGGAGAAMLDLQLLSALIEVQTLGKVHGKPAPARRVTRTDAAVALPLIDGTLSGFAQLLSDREFAPLTGFHFGNWVPDRQTLAAHLPDGSYNFLSLDVDIGDRERRGRMALALPCVPEQVDEPEPEPAAPRTPGFVRAEVLDASARLETELHRLEMTLDKVALLKPGDQVTLPIRALSELRLRSADRQIVATGVLGQIGGNRAVRLTGLGQPCSAATPGVLEQLPKFGAVDMADAGLLETPRPRKPAAPEPAPRQPAPAPRNPEPAAKPQTAALPAPRSDPTGTEALLNELGLGNLDDPAAADDPGKGTGSFMQDLPQRSRSG
ncbi:FliM/FliN family flagellar motor C-terminal domain-containing protein [Thalassovita sp.]|uniref:FliM/FliN family flagellar motor C-terminal domain-containing protein n=1 Tax=Thalassovita sp. TaxID=1979401 RepID=UPI0029DE8246|nr:FliM/FliN family flagellar motor C-terminal domain-containing protein [Thalassovita sp.]